MQLPGGVRLGAHALPAAVRAGDGDGGGARAARAARRPRAQGAAGAHHARAAPSTYLLHPLTCTTRTVQVPFAQLIGSRETVLMFQVIS